MPCVHDEVGGRCRDCASGAHDRAGERMFRCAFDGRSDLQESVGVAREWAGGKREAADEGVLAEGEGSGLIPDDGAQLPRRLEDGSVTHQNPRLSTTAGASDHGGGGGEAHGAGAGDHEHGDGGRYGAHEARLGPEQVPANEGRDGDQQDGRHEYF